jgi:sec-independent protein translocase protein TatC
MRRPNEQDLFSEEQSMPSMSFGDHIEELRARLILAILGLVVGAVIAFIPWPPGWDMTLGKWVFERMQEPAKAALTEYHDRQAKERIAKAAAANAITRPFEVEIAAADFVKVLRKFWPELGEPATDGIDGQNVRLPLVYKQADWIAGVNQYTQRTEGPISLSPLETFMSFFLVGIVTGLVVTSPWVFYQLWTFVAAGLYRHERYYVMKYLPFSLGLFLGGVFLCFFFVLPYTLKFLLDFNVWLKIEPNLRLTDWMGFATFLPLVFGICFQMPLAMMLLERIGIFSVDDFKKRRKIAVLVIAVAAAAITPTGDPLTLALLAVPMYALYELGIRMMSSKNESQVPAATA